MVLLGTVEGVECTVDDLSLGGTGVVAPGSTAAVGDAVEFVVLLPDHSVTLAATVRRRSEPAGGDVELGLEFDPGQTVDIADLALALLSTDVTALQAPHTGAADLSLAA